MADPVAELSRLISKENQYPQTDLKGTVIITGDIVEPMFPEEYCKSLK